MKSKTKGILFAALIVIIAVAAIMILRGTAGNKSEGTSNTSDSSSSQTVSSSALSTSNESTSDKLPSDQESKSTSETTNKANKLAGIAGKYYYLFDNEKINCYVFKFDSKGNVDIAFFDDENIYEGDPKFFKGYSTYKLKDDKIVMDNLSDMLPNKSIKLTIKKNILYYGDTKLESDKELSLNKVNAHFV